MKRFVLVFALAVGLLTSASTLQAQVNTSRYITLTVTNGAAIKLNFKAAADGTPVRIVSGSNTRNITVGTDWTGTASYTANASTMTIYGDLTGFDCDMNRANLTALDVSHNTQLTKLSCFSNSLSDLDVSQNTQLKYLNCSDNTLTSLDVSGCTQLDELYCFNNTLNSLDVSGCTQLKELSCRDNKLTSLDVSGCTQLTKLWCYDNNFTTAALDDIFCALPDRTGKENGVIQPVYSDTSSNHAIVLATNKANAIAKNWKVQYYKNNADIPATTGSYVCPAPEPNMNSYITLTVGSGKAIKLNLQAAVDGTPVRIVSGSTDTTITVDNTYWTGTAPYTAGSSTMTVYGDIIGFNCRDNKENLTAIDVSQNKRLTVLWCHSNLLSSLDISKNTQLNELYCWDNKFSTQALDDIYCALPVRSASDNAEIVPVESASAPNHATVLATNAQNATAKNWKVLYDDGGADIPTTGSYDCSTAVAKASAEQALTLYPNPVADVLYLSATARTIRVYDIYGIEVAHATDTDRIDVANLPSGVYTVRADGTVAKMVKR